MTKMSKEQSIGTAIGTVVGEVLVWFINAGFLMWGWNTIAPHLNCPILSYWEVFAIRMGIDALAKIFKRTEKSA